MGLRAVTVIKKTRLSFFKKLLLLTGEELMIGKDNSKTKPSPHLEKINTHIKSTTEPQLGFITIYPATLLLNIRHS